MDNMLALSKSNEREVPELSDILVPHPYLETNGVRIMPKMLMLANPFEGKIFRETITIRNCGRNPAFIRVLPASSSGVHIKTIKNGVFLASGMQIKRVVTYKVRMMTLIKTCSIPIHINDEDFVDYPIKIGMTPVNLQIKPDTLLDFGQVDAGSMPTKRTLTIVNADVKPARFFIDLGPNELDLAVEPLRGIIMGEDEVKITVTAVFPDEGQYETDLWIIAIIPTYIHVKASVGIASITPQFVPHTPSFTLIQFPITYYGATAVRNVIMTNCSIAQSFFCVLGEIEMETFTLKKLSREVKDYKYFKISPEEGRLLPNDVRVFQFLYSPRLKKKDHKQNYHIVMMRIKRLQLKDLNQDDYPGNLFEEFTVQPASTSERRSSVVSSIYEEYASISSIDYKMPNIPELDKTTSIDVRLMLYGQVEEVNVTVLPDALTLENLEVDETVTRVFQIQNNCQTLPIIFRYQKLAFVDIEPKLGYLNPLESVEVKVLVTPKSYHKHDTNIVFELLYYNEPRTDNELVIVGKCKIPFIMSQKITSKKLPSDPLIGKKFPFKKPNQRPKTPIMNALVKSDIYIGLPDDRPANNLPDPYGRTFKSIYAALPRYQPNINEYALTSHDQSLLDVKNYYNIYINMAAKKKKPESVEDLLLERCRAIPMQPETGKDSDTIVTLEFIPLTPIQLVLIDIEPRNTLVDNVAFNSSYTHTLNVKNGTNSFLKIFLKGRSNEYLFLNGNRFTIPPKTNKDLTFMIYIFAQPVHNYELDVIINNSFVVKTTVLIKARPKRLTLNTDMLTFYENEPPCKFIELHNELNVNIPFQWKVPPSIQVDPMKGEVVSGRFVACMVSFEIGLAENMVYNLGLYTENKFCSLRVLVESTNYKIRIPKVLAFDQLAFNVPCNKIIPLTNFSSQRVNFKVQEKHLPDGFKVLPKDGYINPCATVDLSVSACFNTLGSFKFQLEIIVLYMKKLSCEVSGTVIFPELTFKPDVLRFRKMAASSFDIACITVVNNSDVVAALQFDTDRFPEFSFSEYANTPFLTDKDILYIQAKEEKKFTIHFYPFNPLVTSFPLPLIINKINTSNKSKTVLITRPSIKVYTQVLSYKLEVMSWKYNFKYFPYFDYKNITSHLIKISNPCKSVTTFCIRLDELSEPFRFKYKEGVKPIDYKWSMVVELQSDDFVTFEASYNPVEPGEHNIRLPVYIRDDFTQDMHNYFYFEGVFPKATYKFKEESIHLGCIPLNFTVSKRIFIDMSYHYPNCNCTASINDSHSYVEIDLTPPSSINFCKLVSIVFSSPLTHVLNARLQLACKCPGPNLEIEVYGGCENNYITIHACIQYYKHTATTSFTTMFENGEDMPNISTITVADADKEQMCRHIYKTCLPYFPTGNDFFDAYMNQIVAIFEKWLYEQIFFGMKFYSIPNTICIPDIKHYEKQGKPEAIIKLPLQHIMNILIGPLFMAPFEIKYSEKKPIWMIIRKFYRELLNFLMTMGCFVNMIRCEILLPYNMYQEFMIHMERSENILPAKWFNLMAKQAWLDLLMQSYKVLVCRRILQNAQALSSPAARSLMAMMNVSSNDLPITERGGITVSMVNIFSEEAVMLIQWVNKHYQELKEKFINTHEGNEMSDTFKRSKIETYDDDLSDGLGIISCIVANCCFLEEYLTGIYAPAMDRMEKFNNAYILIKMLTLLQVSFKLKPIDIIEPNTVHMIMFLTYLYDFLQPLKGQETLVISAELSETKVEEISIFNDNPRKIYYKVIFFNNTDDLFSVKESLITVNPGTPYKLALHYTCRFLRVQKTVLLLSGEIPGYQYTNSKIYYIEGRPMFSKSKIPSIELKSVIYQITQVSFDIQSPYKAQGSYDIYIVNDSIPEVGFILESMIAYESILETSALMRCKFHSAVGEADETGKIPMMADICNTINTIKKSWILFRNKTIGDFIVNIDIITKPMKKVSLLMLHLQKKLSHFPCTCPKKRPDVTNTKCPRNAKVMIPCRNVYLWNAVMTSFLAGRDPEEAEFWDIYGNTPVGSHIVERLLYDHKKFLNEDMAYFMNKTFTYMVRTKSPDLIVTQKKKVIDEAAMLQEKTEILVHFNEIINSFYLILESTDEKETRTYKVRVNYD